MFFWRKKSPKISVNKVSKTMENLVEKVSVSLKKETLSQIKENPVAFFKIRNLQHNGLQRWF